MVQLAQRFLLEGACECALNNNAIVRAAMPWASMQHPLRLLTMPLGQWEALAVLAS